MFTDIKKYNDSRYNALNIHSWLYRGSIECRMHHGTIRADKIVNWGLLWVAILDYAFEHNEMDIKALKGDGFQILMGIAPNEDIKKWLVERKTKFSGQVDERQGDL